MVNDNRNLDFFDVITALPCKFHPNGWFLKFQRQYFILNNPFSLEVYIAFTND